MKGVKVAVFTLTQLVVAVRVKVTAAPVCAPEKIHDWPLWVDVDPCTLFVQERWRAKAHPSERMVLHCCGHYLLLHSPFSAGTSREYRVVQVLTSWSTNTYAELARPPVEHPPPMATSSALHAGPARGMLFTAVPATPLAQRLAPPAPTAQPAVEATLAVQTQVVVACLIVPNDERPLFRASVASVRPYTGRDKRRYSKWWMSE